MHSRSLESVVCQVCSYTTTPLRLTPLRLIIRSKPAPKVAQLRRCQLCPICGCPSNPTPSKSEVGLETQPNPKRRGLAWFDDHVTRVRAPFDTFALIFRSFFPESRTQSESEGRREVQPG